jgi:hypothetical protein
MEERMVDRKWLTIGITSVAIAAALGTARVGSAHTSVDQDMLTAKDAGAFELAAKDAGVLELAAKDGGVLELTAKDSGAFQLAAKDGGVFELAAKLAAKEGGGW